MKILVNRPFKYTLDNITTHVLEAGKQEVTKEVADLAIGFRCATLFIEPKEVVKKVAPENKVLTAAPGNKAEPAKAAKRKTRKAKK